MQKYRLLAFYLCLGFLFLAGCSVSSQGLPQTSPSMAASPTSSNNFHPTDFVTATSSSIPATADGAFGNLPPLQPITNANAQNIQLLKTLQIPEFARSAISQASVDFSPDGRLLSGVCYQNTVPVWEVESGRLLFTLLQFPAHEVAVSFQPNGHLVAIGGFSGKIELYDTATSTFFGSTSTLPSPIWDLDFSPIGDKLASANFSSGVHLWDVAGLEPLWNYGEKDRLQVLSVAYQPTGETIACGTLTDGVLVLNAEMGELLWDSPISTPVGDVAFSLNGQLLASGSDDFKIRLWRTSDEQLLATFTGHSHYVNGVAFTPDGSLLVSGSHDRKVGIWDVQSGQLLKMLDGHQDVVLRVAVNSSGTLIASISWDGTVRLWGVVDGDR